MNRLTCTALLLISGISFCSTYAQNGPVIEYYPDGQLKKETFSKRGKNYHIEYYPDGQLKYTRNVNLETKKKITEVYYKDGTLKSKLRNKSDKKGDKK